MRKRIVLLSAIVMCLLLCSCRQSAPSGAEIISDIPDDFITVKIDGSITPMQIKNLDVAKRQTNEKDDHIYGTLTLSNSDYELKADCYFRYNYYDEGGWILDYGEINGDYKLSPLSKISKNSAEESLNIPSAISC